MNLLSAKKQNINGKVRIKNKDFMERARNFLHWLTIYQINGNWWKGDSSNFDKNDKNYSFEMQREPKVVQTKNSQF